MRLGRTILWVLGTAGALLGLVAGGGGWVYAGQLLPAPTRDRALDVTATLTGRGTVLITPDRRACLERFGLLLEGGAFLVFSGPVVAGSCDGGRDTPGVVERTIESLSDGQAGAPAPDRTIGARFDEYVVGQDPGDVGLDFTEVEIPLGGSLGSAPAWLVEGARSDTVIFVHGRSGTRAEALRVLPSVVEAGYSALVITHRNDNSGGPPTADGVGRFGQQEWPDLRAAVTLASQRGAENIVLLGYSQGASLISYYLRNVGSQGIAGLVFDSPLLSLDSTLRQQARLRDIPDPLIPPILFGTRQVAQLRAGFDIGDVEHVEALSTLEVPLLLIHGDADDFVPIEPTDDLAGARQIRGLDTTYLRIEGAGHVEGWNTDADRYTAAVTDFLTRVTP